MKLLILLFFTFMVLVCAQPENRVRRDGNWIKAGGAWSSRYGAGGQIVANKNIANGKHYSIDAQAKYNQFGKHKEGWGGINYQLRWRK